ncbi:uncharacterized protein LOC113463813 isoform X1 [Ceratina calcarata]|uniref:Uncharacterized protein LOC113463813 isoform X1 n=1 Tax=Ceratina calcarata TaxID=156304 RepID=A0AAJ7S136_9HYME|nr:uncharacterized protein LOC113463813 isoform X1 [Ceratina calcarata]
MLYLSNNNLIEVPEEIFTALKYLEWFDVRNNQLTCLPTSIKRHMCLETILLQGNKMEYLPLELCTLANLKTLQVAENPLIVPPKHIVASGCAAILEFLRTEWNNAHPEEKVEPKENKIEPKLSTILCYQSPRMHKKKIAPLNDAVYDKNVSTREKRISYKPSNRYYGEISFSNNTYTLEEKLKFYNSCLQKMTEFKSRKKQQFTDETDNYLENEIKEINDKILHLTGPSPRSVYVRKNVGILKTYRRAIEKECRRVVNKVNMPVFVKIKNKTPLRKNDNKYKDDIEDGERVFDIVTKDGKRFQLNPLRLNDSNWMFSCLQNYIGIKE